MTAHSNITTNTRHRPGYLAARTLAAGLLIAAAMSAEVHASPAVGTVPIYSGPAPAYGGDPVVGETQESYVARTGDPMPVACLTSNSTPVVGGASAAGEAGDSPSRTPRRAASLAPAITNPITCAATER